MEQTRSDAVKAVAAAKRAPASTVGAAKPGGAPAADSSVQRCAYQLASAVLQQPQQEQAGEKADPTLQTARPKRR